MGMSVDSEERVISVWKTVRQGPLEEIHAQVAGAAVGGAEDDIE